jgi:hypothetical protein
MTIIIEDQDVGCATRLTEALSKQIKEFQKVVGRLGKGWPALANFRTSCTREKERILFTACNKIYLAFLISISIFGTYPPSLGGKIYLFVN